VTAFSQTAYRGAARADAEAVGRWLLAVAGMVFAMAVIGAITRLTESGLSIVEWQLVTGVLPPLDEAQWLAEFEKYRQIPEYQQINRGMSLDEFKYIYFWEWFHRLWGRLIGVAYALPLAWFWLRGRIPQGYKAPLLGLLLLGGLQGFMGWFMVQSGLTERTDVSHYRLAMHLGLAFVLYALLIALALSLFEDRRPREWAAAPRPLRLHAHAALGLLAATIVWGAFVAGTDAGLAASDFPTVNGVWIPAEAFDGDPAVYVEAPVAIQWLHRILATLTLLAVLSFWARTRRVEAGRLPWLARGLAFAVLAQYALGIATVETGVSIPVAAAHQAGAMVLLALFVWTLYELRGPRGAATAPAA
jgi:cytochrome c oxidase assembly protein subunit 15